ncbi:transposase [Streptomyces rubiginosohelvolus]|uniref:transposase n=1 Tax=Streptomyces rubiginosohelvolus TaxID=67362 RepID=UPI0036C0F822
MSPGDVPAGPTKARRTSSDSAVHKGAGVALRPGSGSASTSARTTRRRPGPSTRTAPTTAAPGRPSRRSPTGAVHDAARAAVARLVLDELGSREVVLVVDGTRDAKSSTDCDGAGRQYSGALGGVGLCQVAVHLAVVTDAMRVVIDRAAYLPADWPRTRSAMSWPEFRRRSSSPPSRSRREQRWMSWKAGKRLSTGLLETLRRNG